MRSQYDISNTLPFLFIYFIDYVFTINMMFVFHEVLGHDIWFFLFVWTNSISIILSLIYCMMKWYLVSMFLVLFTVGFFEIKISTLLSTWNLIGNLNLIFKNTRIPLINKISLIIYDSYTYSASVELVVTIGCCFEDHDTRFELM